MLRCLGLCLSLSACLESGDSEPTSFAAEAGAAQSLDATLAIPISYADAARPPSSDPTDAALPAPPVAMASPDDAGLGAGDAGSARSTLPVPPGAADKPRPSGAVANLRVLSWAGFAGAASYTFDDGQPSHLEHWPAIKATQARVTFYVTTAYRDISKGFDATWKDVVASGSEVGNHTVNHCYYSGKSCGVDGKTILTPKSRELTECNDYLTKTAGQSDVWTAATPFGDADWAVETKSRFLLTRGTIAGVGGDGMVAPRDNNDPQNLPTVVVQQGQGAADFNKATDAARDRHKWAILLFHSIAPSKSEWFATVAIGAITGSIVHAQQLGDLWLDSVVHVGAYWLAEKLVSNAKPQVGSGGEQWTWQVPAHFPKGQFLRVKVDGGTLRQNGQPLQWDGHGYYEVALDVGELSWSP
jgi:peptidoglycan/xylan/chitin deacetylase (PgdA/CDA1 family)